MRGSQRKVELTGFVICRPQEELIWRVDFYCRVFLFLLDWLRRHSIWGLRNLLSWGRLSLRKSLFLHMLDMRLRRRRRRLGMISWTFCILYRHRRRWRKRLHRRDVTSSLFKERRSWRCRIATTCYLNRLLRHGRQEFLEGEGGEAPLLLLLLLLFALLMIGFVTASWHGWVMKAV